MHFDPFDVTPQPQPWYKSRLLWLGVLQVGAAVLSSLSALLAKATITPADVALFGAGVLTIVLKVFFPDPVVIPPQWVQRSRQRQR